MNGRLPAQTAPSAVVRAHQPALSAGQSQGDEHRQCPEQRAREDEVPPWDGHRQVVERGPSERAVRMQYKARRRLPWHEPIFEGETHGDVIVGEVPRRTDKPRGRDQCGHPDERQDERSPVQPDPGVTHGRIVGTRRRKPDERDQPGQHRQERRQTIDETDRDRAADGNQAVASGGPCCLGREGVPLPVDVMGVGDGRMLDDRAEATCPAAGAVRS